MSKLPTLKDMATEFFVDFRLREIRQKSNLHNVIPFVELAEHTKARIRGIRARVGAPDYIEGLDDDDDGGRFAYIKE